MHERIVKLLVISFWFACVDALEGLVTRTPGGIHVPISRNVSPRGLQRRDDVGAIGLGNYFDVSYSVLLTIGSIQTPLILDTGSSDLWVISTECETEDCDTTVPLYPHDTFVSSDIPVELYYGDSRTGTHAFGTIGQDNVELAGLSLEDHYIASIHDTNTSVLDTGATGIFGLGFPVNSFIWSKTFFDTYASRRQRRDATPPPSWSRRALNLGRRIFPTFDFTRPMFPDLKKLTGRQSSTSSEWTPIITSSYSTLGPFLPRLISLAGLEAPMFTVTLQRNSIERGGNVGLLSIGGLPEQVKNETLTWVPIRTYPAGEQGGLSAPPDSPDEEYPIAWEVFIDAVYFDGELLPTSSLVSRSIAPSALIDTGNSLIRGPEDVISTIYTKLGGDQFLCSAPHTLTFEIGGRMFPVDPRDFVSQAFADDTSACIANIAVTDSPVVGEGYLYSWSLGDPFLRSVLSSYYYGNLSHPNQDPARIGFLSTVPQDAGERYTSVLRTADKNLYASAEPAPTGLPIAAGTNSVGVQEAQTTGTARDQNGAVLPRTCRTMWLVTFFVILGVVDL